jgi:hypothetical protein
MGNAQQNFYEALSCLVSEGPLPRRLASAAQYLTRLMPDQFTKSEDRKAWERIRDDLAWVEARHRGEGSIGATTRQMTPYDAERSAREILDLFVKLSGGLR